jgi:serine/threonine protein kinase
MVEHPGIGERYILIDFGIVKLIYAQDPKLTGRNVLLGTEGYRPPEQIADKHFDARSDVYSLSAVMYTMLSGLPPFTKLRDENTGDFLNRVQTEDPECLLRLRKGLDPVLAEIVMAGMSKDPGKRCQDCGRLIATLEWYERAYLS